MQKGNHRYINRKILAAKHRGRMIHKILQIRIRQKRRHLLKIVSLRPVTKPRKEHPRK
jgi:hypothetical protein